MTQDRPPLTFPTYVEWLDQEFEFGPLVAEDHTAEKLKRFYALDFLTELCKWVNRNYRDTTPAYQRPSYDDVFAVYYDLDRWDLKPVSYFQKDMLFTFYDLDVAQGFLYYHGSGTSTVEQLNILYGIIEPNPRESGGLSKETIEDIKRKLK